MNLFLSFPNKIQLVSVMEGGGDWVLDGDLKLDNSCQNDAEMLPDTVVVMVEELLLLFPTLPDTLPLELEELVKSRAIE